MMVLNIESIKDKKVSYIVKIDKNKFLLNIYVENEEERINASKYRYGNILISNCNLKNIENLGNPYEFDYKKYLNSNDICGLLTTNKVSLKSETNGNIFYKLISNYKEKLSEKIEENLLEDEANVLKSILYNDKLFLDEDIKNSMSDIGISHILSISSFSIVYVLFLVEKLRKVYSKNKVTILKIISLIFILALSNFKVSLIRTVTIYLINLIFEDYIKINKYIKLIISAYLIMSM